MKVSRSTIITLGVLLLCVLVLAAVVYLVQQRAAERDRELSAAGVALAPETQTFTSLAGESVDLFTNTNTPLVVYTWASWCPQCRAGLEQLSQIADEIKQRNIPATFVAINRSEPTATAERFLQTVTLSDLVQVVIDEEDSYYAAIGGYAMPELVVFSIGGDEVLRQRGNIDENAIIKVLEAAAETEK